MRMLKVKNYKEHLLKQLQDPEEFAAYLSAAFLDDSPCALLLALRDITESQKGKSV